MSTKARYVNGVLTYFDGNTFESVAPLAPIVFYDDFLGKAIDATSQWATKDVSAAGLTTPLFGANVGNGVLRLPLDVTSEAQESGLYFADQRPFVLNQGLIFEARVALQTLPTLLGIGVFGLAGAYNAVADTVAESIWFRSDASGAITVESDDTANEQTKVSTGITVVAAAFHIFRIDCTTITSVKFYIDGARVAASTTFDMSTVATLALQPYFHLAKASGAGLGVIDIDYVKVWQNRS